MSAETPDDELPPRLMTERSDEGRAVRRYLRHPHSASEARVWPRVWQRLAASKRATATPRRPWAPVAWAAAGAAVVVALGLFSRGDRPLREVAQEPISPQSIALGPTATMLAPGKWTIPDEATLELGIGSSGSAEEISPGVPRVTLMQGRVRMAVEHKPRPASFEVVSPPYRFTVLGTTFAVERGATDVSLSVEEGRVAVSHGEHLLETVVTGGRWSGPVVPPPPAAVTATAPSKRDRKPSLHPGRAVALRERPSPSVQAQAGPGAERCGVGSTTAGPEHLKCLEHQAAGTGLDAEIALYEIGKIKRGALGDPAGALAAFQSLRERFPDGTLRAEAELSAVELLARLGRHRAALDASATLLQEGRVGERAAELHLLRGNLYRESLGDLARAATEYRLAAGGSSHKATDDKASFLLAVTLEGLGRRAEAADAYRRYLQRPNPAHEADARARLRRLE